MSSAIFRNARGFISLGRFLSSEATAGIPRLSFEEVQKELKRSQVLFLDVREKDELVTDGRLHQDAKNIPCQVEGAIKLDTTSFKKIYGFDKPKSDVELVVHCRAGVRAMQAAASFTQAGYSNVKVYDGLLDWLSNGGTVLK